MSAAATEFNQKARQMVVHSSCLLTIHLKLCSVLARRYALLCYADVFFPSPYYTGSVFSLAEVLDILAN
jgi:hypothetical protein